MQSWVAKEYPKHSNAFKDIDGFKFYHLKVDDLSSLGVDSNREEMWHEMKKCIRNKLGVREWSPLNVQEWATRAGFFRYRSKFENVGGGDLLDLSIGDLQRKVLMQDEGDKTKFEVEIELLRNLQVFNKICFHFLTISRHTQKFLKLQRK